MMGLTFVPDKKMQCDNNDTNTSKKARTLWIYGTHLHHLEDFSGRRSSEMKKLLDHVQTRSQTDSFLIVGDFNQQREQDYTQTEWERILANKEHRFEETKHTDGVAELLQSSGFECAWEAAPSRNWPTQDPPPSTHWTGTVVDYAYSRNLQNVGAYVSPAGMSDHRLVITDWITE